MGKAVNKAAIIIEVIMEQVLVNTALFKAVAIYNYQIKLQ